MNKKIKALLFQFLSFALLFVIARFFVITFTNASGFWIPAISAIVSTILAPQFKAIETQQGLKLYMNWIFMKQPKEIK